MVSIKEIIAGAEITKAEPYQYPHSEAYRHYLAGVMCLDKSDYDNASTYFTKSLRLTPDHVPTRFLLAKAKFLNGEFAESLELIEATRRDCPDHPGAKLYQIAALGESQRWQEIIERTEQDETLFQVSGEVRLWYVLALLNTGKSDNAKRVYDAVSKNALNRNPLLRKRIVAELNAG